MKIRAELHRQRDPLWPGQHQVDKVVELPNAAFASFMIQPLHQFDFIADHKIEPHQGDGFTHCLLVLSDERADGALIQCGDDGRAMCSAYVAGARDIVQARLDQAADFIIRQGTAHTVSGYWCFYYEELEKKFGLAISEGSGLDAMLKGTLERCPEVAAVDIANGAVETTFHPEFCMELRGSAVEEAPDIRLRDILPLLKGGGLTFLTHEDTDISVLAENLCALTNAGREDHAALLNARVSEISPGPEGMEVVPADVDPQELARFNRALEAFETAEQAAEPVM